MRNYDELISYSDWESRVRYLLLFGEVGSETFGSARWVNQQFYRSPEWKRTKRQAIIRDNACDLGIDNYDIFGRVYVHHIVPIDEDMVIQRSPLLLDLNNLVTVSFDTHNLIHYGNLENAAVVPVVRKPNDTCPWKEA